MPKQHKSKTVYDSIDAAAAALKTTPTQLKIAKRRGAPGFRGSRVYLEELLPWLNENWEDAPDKESMQIAKLKEDIRRLKIANDAKEKKTVDAATEAAWLGEVLRDMLATLEQKLCNEMPALVENLTADQIRFRAKKIYDDVVAKIAPLGRRHAERLAS